MPTKDQLVRALKRADSAGDTAAATAIAKIIREGRFDAGPAVGPKPAGAETPTQAMAQGAGRGMTGLLDMAASAGQRAGGFLSIPAMAAAHAMGATPQQNVAGQNFAAATTASPTPVTDIAAQQGLQRQAREPGNQPYFTFGEVAAPSIAQAPFLPGKVANVVGSIGAGVGAAAGESIGGEKGQLLGGLLGGFVPSLAGETVMRGLRGGPASQAAVRETVEAVQGAGVKPTYSSAGGGGLSEFTEGLTSKMLGGYGIARRRGEANAKAMQESVNRVADALSKGSDEVVAGGAVQRGIKGVGGFVDRFQARANELYRAADRLIPGTRRVDPQNTFRVVDDLSIRNQDVAEVLESLQPDRLARFTSAMDEVSFTGKGVSYTDLRAIRSAVGKRLTGAALVDDIDRRDLKQLYGALSEDLRAAASTAGDDAVKAMDKANDFYRRNLEHIETRLTPLVGNANKTAEQVFKALMSSAKTGPTTVSAIRRSLKPEEWKMVQAATIRRMGQGKPSSQDALGEVFSPETFLTTWNQLNPRAKMQLFKQPPVRNAMTKLAKAAELVRREREILPNPSGSGQVAIQGGQVLAAGAAIGSGNLGTLAGVLSTIGGAAAHQAMAGSPRFIQWLAKTPSVPVAQIPAHIRQLEQVAKDVDAREAVQQILSAFNEESSNGN